MRVILLGGAPGVGKTTVARRLLASAEGGRTFVQWVDVDTLWLHQPWRVDDETKALVQANLAAIMQNARNARVDVLLLTWVFQSTEMQALVSGLAPEDAVLETVQLLASEHIWRRRFESDPERPPLVPFYEDRYRGAQSTPADHLLDTDGGEPSAIANELAAILGLER